jgi:hypothetical protein
MALEAGMKKLNAKDPETQAADIPLDSARHLRSCRTESDALFELLPRLGLDQHGISHVRGL